MRQPFCKKINCLKIGHAAKQGMVDFKYLQVFLSACNTCSTHSGCMVAKETSHTIDLAFANSLLQSIEKNVQSRNVFKSLINDLKHNIIEHNGFSKVDEIEIDNTLKDAVEKGKITFNHSVFLSDSH